MIAKTYFTSNSSLNNFERWKAASFKRWTPDISIDIYPGVSSLKNLAGRDGMKTAIELLNDECQSIA